MPIKPTETCLFFSITVKTQRCLETTNIAYHEYVIFIYLFFTYMYIVYLFPQQEPKKGLLYVNICSWKHVPAPQDPSKPVPLCAGKLETDTSEDQGKRQRCAASQATALALCNTLLTGNSIKCVFFPAGLCTVLDVAFNPVVLQESKKHQKEINHIYMLALSVAHQKHGLILSQQYTVISCSPKSSPDDLHRRLCFQHWPNVSKRPATGRAISLKH